MLPISFNHDWSYCESSGNMIFDPRAAQAERIPVTLPHDATIHEKRSADAASGTAKGYYPNKDYDYFKTIDVPAEWADKRVWLRFEGAYMNARVFVNGAFAGQRVKRRLPLALLARYGGANGLASAGRGRVRRWVGAQRGFGHRGLLFVEEVFSAIASQSVEIVSSAFYDELIKIEAASLRSALDARERVGRRVDELLASMPDARVLLSMPGLGRVTAATFIAEVGDISRFSSAAKLAAYAGLAPRVRQSGRSLNSVTKPRAGNKRLKRAWVLSAARSIDFCEESRAYYDRKRAEGRCHYSAVIALARRRINVAYAMLRDGQRFESRLG